MSCCDKAIVVQSAQDFANVAAELMPKTQVFYISQAEITEKSISMSLWNEEVLQVTGIKQIHVIECSSEGNIKLLKSARSNECETYSEGDWVLVTYDAEKYPGEVKTVKTEEIEVSCMIRSGKYWKWPRNPDIAHYTFGNVIGKLDPPIPATSRGQFYFEKL
nr:uncharacterized protein LOC122268771 [Parasteatoda tepidariorum]